MTSPSHSASSAAWKTVYLRDITVSSGWAASLPEEARLFSTGGLSQVFPIRDLFVPRGRGRRHVFFSVFWRIKRLKWFESCFTKSDPAFVSPSTGTAVTQQQNVWFTQRFMCPLDTCHPSRESYWSRQTLQFGTDTAWPTEAMKIYHHINPRKVKYKAELTTTLQPHVLSQ